VVKTALRKDSAVKVFVGSDHRGVSFKNKIKDVLQAEGYEVTDVGTNDPEVGCDYPGIAYQVATRVAASPEGRGVLVCLSGVGQAIAANKVPGAYAALCHNTEIARLSRQHNNANILVLGERFVDPAELETILKVWFSTPFEGGRHQRRIDQIKAIERGLWHGAAPKSA